MPDRPALCRAHQTAADTIRAAERARVVILALTLAALAVGVVLLLNDLRTATILVAIPAGLAAAYNAFHQHPMIKRRTRWLYNGLAQCGSCRAVREGRRTPDGAPLG